MVSDRFVKLLFHNDEFRNALLNSIRMQKGLSEMKEPVYFGRLREKNFDKLAEQVRRHVNLELIYQQMKVYSEYRFQNVHPAGRY